MGVSTHRPPDALPQLPDLGSLNEEMAVRLPLAASAPPTCAGADCAGPLGEVRTDWRVSGEELEEQASHRLSLYLQIREDLLACWRLVSLAAFDMARDPVSRTL